MNKTQLRRYYRDIRRQVPAEYKQNASLAAAHLLVSQPLFQQAEHIACYMAYKDEFDLVSIIHAVWGAAKHCYLPVLVQRNEQAELHFSAYNRDEALIVNRYGIPEPDAGAQPIEIGQLDLVLVPLIAFDRRGHRLGTGGGYYDRTFRDRREKPVLIGIGYAAQEVETLPDDPWDIRLDGILTEKEFMKF